LAAILAVDAAAYSRLTGPMKLARWWPWSHIDARWSILQLPGIMAASSRRRGD